MRPAQGEANVIADALQIEPVYIAPFLAIPFIVVLLIIMMVSTEYMKRRKKIRQKAENEFDWHG